MLIILFSKQWTFWWKLSLQNKANFVVIISSSSLLLSLISSEFWLPPRLPQLSESVKFTAMIYSFRVAIYFLLRKTEKVFQSYLNEYVLSKGHRQSMSKVKILWKQKIINGLRIYILMLLNDSQQYQLLLKYWWLMPYWRFKGIGLWHINHYLCP